MNSKRSKIKPSEAPVRKNTTPASEKKQSIWKLLGPGVVTGAADDDPSGIATYSQAGAATGFALLWTIWLTFPLMVAIQMICARIGCVTGKGLAANMREHSSRFLLYGIVVLLFVANTINIGADVVAMGAAVKLLIGGPAVVYALILAAASLALQVFIPFTTYSRLLKYLTLTLFTYVATVFFVKVPWGEVAYSSFVPGIHFSSANVTMIVAIFGTTISPYLFFWQASHEVEKIKANASDKALKQDPKQAVPQLNRITADTVTGMAVSNLVAFFIIVTAAITLHAKGMTDIQTSAQAAQALEPAAGKFAFFLFSIGIIGTGLLAVPVLAASTAYATAEAFGWRLGLENKFRAAPAFYGVIIAGMVCGMGLAFTPIDPVKALVWSAVINGVIAVPIMLVVMRIASTRRAMGKFVVSWPLRIFGWLAALAMAIAVLSMGWMQIKGM